MKTKLLSSGLSLIFAGLLCACSNETDYLSEQSATNENQEIFEQTIKFAGNTYHVSCMMQNDSLIYLDEDFSSLYRNEISKIPELTTFVYKDETGNDIIEYYASEQELMTQKKISYYDAKAIAANEQSRAETTLEPKAGRAILYDDTGFKDRTVILNADYDQYPIINNLKAYAGFNDKTSAIRVFNFLEPNKSYQPSYAPPFIPGATNPAMKGSQLRTCLIGYEDSDLKGKKLFCVATYSSGQDLNRPETASHQDYKLKNIGWNDKISSCIFRIITVENISNGDITPHDPV